MALWNEVEQLQEAIRILEGKLALAGLRSVRKKIAEIQSQIDDLRKVIFEKLRQLRSGDAGCRPFNDIPEDPKDGGSILVPQQGPPPPLWPPVDPKRVEPPTNADDGFAMNPRNDLSLMLG